MSFHSFETIWSGCPTKCKNIEGINVMYTDTGWSPSLSRRVAPSSCFLHRRCSPICTNFVRLRRNREQCRTLRCIHSDCKCPSTRVAVGLSLKAPSLNDCALRSMRACCGVMYAPLAHKIGGLFRPFA